MGSLVTTSQNPGPGGRGTYSGISGNYLTEPWAGGGGVPTVGSLVTTSQNPGPGGGRVPTVGSLVTTSQNPGPGGGAGYLQWDLW